MGTQVARTGENVVKERVQVAQVKQKVPWAKGEVMRP